MCRYSARVCIHVFIDEPLMFIFLTNISYSILFHRVIANPRPARSSSWRCTFAAWLRSPGGLVWRSPGSWQLALNGATRRSRIRRICSTCLPGPFPHCKRFAFWRWEKSKVSASRRRALFVASTAALFDKSCVGGQ